MRIKIKKPTLDGVFLSNSTTTALVVPLSPQSLESCLSQAKSLCSVVDYNIKVCTVTLPPQSDSNLPFPLSFNKNSVLQINCSQHTPYPSLLPTSTQAPPLIWKATLHLLHLSECHQCKIMPPLSIPTMTNSSSPS